MSKISTKVLKKNPHHHLPQVPGEKVHVRALPAEADVLYRSVQAERDRPPDHDQLVDHLAWILLPRPGSPSSFGSAGPFLVKTARLLDLEPQRIRFQRGITLCPALALGGSQHL